MNLKETYNKIAKDWMEDHHGDTWWIEGTDKFLSYIAPNLSLLDVGCGAGEKSKYLVKRGFNVTGIDFSNEMINLAKEQVPTGRFILKDILKPLELDELFDGVFAKAVLLHIPKNQLNDVLTNITEPLIPGGYFFVMVKEIKPGQAEEEIRKEDD